MRREGGVLTGCVPQSLEKTAVSFLRDHNDPSPISHPSSNYRDKCLDFWRVCIPIRAAALGEQSLPTAVFASRGAPPLHFHYAARLEGTVFTPYLFGRTCYHRYVPSNISPTLLVLMRGPKKTSAREFWRYFQAPLAPYPPLHRLH